MLFAIFLLLILALGALALARRKRHATGLPAGRVVYGDTSAWNRVDSPIISRRYGLVGKPDYLVEILDGKRRLVIPVEVKSRTKPSTPYASHILQLATYCLLVEDRYRVRPSYGLLHYADATLEIPFDDAIRRDVLAVAEKIRAARSARRLGREHNDAGRCRACGYLQACGNEALTVESEPNPPASAA